MNFKDERPGARLPSCLRCPRSEQSSPQRSGAQALRSREFFASFTCPNLLITQVFKLFGAIFFYWFSIIFSCIFQRIASEVEIAELRELIKSGLEENSKLKVLIFSTFALFWNSSGAGSRELRVISGSFHRTYQALSRGWSDGEMSLPWWHFERESGLKMPFWLCLRSDFGSNRSISGVRQPSLPVDPCILRSAVHARTRRLRDSRQLQSQWAFFLLKHYHTGWLFMPFVV